MRMKWLYWGATGILALIYFAGAAMYLSDIAGVKQVFATFGYPAYLVPILALAKLAGSVTILGRFSVAFSDLAYAGMFFHLLLAFSAHINAGDGGFVARGRGPRCACRVLLHAKSRAGHAYALWLLARSIREGQHENRPEDREAVPMRLG